MKHILFILRTLPYPIDRDGLTLINYRLLKMAPKDYTFDIISLSEETEFIVSETKKINRNINQIILLPDKALNSPLLRFFRLILGALCSRSVSYDNFLKLNAGRYDMIYICTPPSALFLTIHKYDTPIFVNAVDSFSMLNFRFYKYRKNCVSLTKYLLYKLIEKKCFRHPQLINFVSSVDMDYTNKNLDCTKTVTIHNGVDFNYYECKKDIMRDPESLLFVGNYSNVSNVLSIEYFCHEIYPLLKKKRPQLKLYIVGPHAHFNFADRDIIVTGYVEDLRDYYHRCTVFIAPLVTGSGIKNKVLEAMAAGIPVVTSSIGIDGINVEDGKHVIIANNLLQWNSGILNLLCDSELCRQLSINGREYIAANYDWNILINDYFLSFNSIEN